MASKFFTTVCKVILFLITISIFFLVFLFFFIDFRTQVIDLNSPDNTLKVIASIRDGGATTSYSTNLCIQSYSQNKKRESDSFFQADKIKNLDVVWSATEEIDLYFEEARISHYNNVVRIRDSQGKSRRIKINLFQVDTSSKYPRSLFLQYSKYERVL